MHNVLNFFPISKTKGRPIWTTDTQRLLKYRVFIKYCVFYEDFKIFRSLFSLGASVCTHTRQVEHQRCSRTGRVQKYHKILRKNTIINEHPV